jgi:hypothetical protein
MKIIGPGKIIGDFGSLKPWDDGSTPGAVDQTWVKS